MGSTRRTKAEKARNGASDAKAPCHSGPFGGLWELPDLVVSLILVHVERDAAQVVDSAALNEDNYDSNPNPLAGRRLAEVAALERTSRVCRQWWRLARARLWRSLVPVDLPRWTMQMDILRRSFGVSDQWPKLPAPIEIDFSACETYDLGLITDALIESGYHDPGVLRALHFPQFDRFVRYDESGTKRAVSDGVKAVFGTLLAPFVSYCCDSGLWSPDDLDKDRQLTLQFVRSALPKYQFVQDQQNSPPSPYASSCARPPLSDLRMLTLPVSWEWSDHLHDLVTDELLTFIGAWCPRLERIPALGGDRLIRAGVLDLVRGCPRLKMLRIWKSPEQTDEVLTEIARNLPNLEEFALSFAQRITPRGLEPVFRLLSLRGIDLTCCRSVVFTRELAEVFSSSGAYQRLRGLDLSIDLYELDELEQGVAPHYALCDSEANILERELLGMLEASGAMDHFTNHGYESLRSIVEEDVWTLGSSLGYLASLRKGHFYASLARFETLTTLILSGHAALTDLRLAMLFPPRGGLTSLIRLGLGSCWRLTDHGFDHLVRYGGPRMEQLELVHSNPDITDRSILALARKWGHSLRVLELSECEGLTTKGLDELSKLLVLSDARVGFMDLPVSPSFRARFGQRHPEGVVFGWIDWELVEFPILSGLRHEIQDLDEPGNGDGDEE